MMGHAAEVWRLIESVQAWPARTFSAGLQCILSVRHTIQYAISVHRAGDTIVPCLQGMPQAPAVSQPDPRDLYAPELTIEQLEPALRLPTDRGRISPSGKYPAVESLQVHLSAAALAASAVAASLAPAASMAQLPEPAP